MTEPKRDEAPLPWRAERSGANIVVRDAESAFLFATHTMDDRDFQAIARAVRAVNGEAKLREALRKVDGILRDYWNAEDRDALVLCEAGDIIRAALAASEP